MNKLRELIEEAEHFLQDSAERMRSLRLYAAVGRIEVGRDIVADMFKAFRSFCGSIGRKSYSSEQCFCEADKIENVVLADGIITPDERPQVKQMHALRARGLKGLREISEEVAA